MIKYATGLTRRVVLLALVFSSLGLLEACQLNGTAQQELRPASLHVNKPVMSEEKSAPQVRASETERTLRVRQPPSKARLSEQHFVIPVNRSGGFAPDQLDDYVLSIIEQSRQWDYVAELQIHGHTDSEGSELSNMLLSIRRANFVAERFEELGVEAGLLLIEAHGETQAIADNTTLDGRIANRRIEVVLIGNAGGAEKGDQYDAVVAQRRSQGEQR